LSNQKFQIVAFIRNSLNSIFTFSDHLSESARLIELNLIIITLVIRAKTILG